MMIKYTKFVLALIAAMAFGIANGGYPSGGFDRIGHVDNLNVETRQIVINDSVYRLSDNVVFHSSSRTSNTLGALAKGTKVGFIFSSAGYRSTIREIWQLPSTYTPKEGSIKGIDGPIDPRLLK